MAPATVLPGYVHRIRAGDDAARGRRGIGSNRFVQMSNQAFLYCEALKTLLFCLKIYLGICGWKRKESPGQRVSVTSGGGMPEVLAYEFCLKRICPAAVERDTS